MFAEEKIKKKNVKLK